jgi:hypothetical protein
MRLLIIAAVIAVTGCASNTGVTPMGGGTYMIAAQAATGIGGLGNIKADLLREADQFCTGKGQEMDLVRIQENEGPYVFGKYPRAEVQFKCSGKR